MSLSAFRVYAGGLGFALALLAAACGQPSASPGAPDLAVILADKPAPVLSAYGLFKDASGREPGEGVIPYDLINPLFSDHAAKHRAVFVPPGEAATYDAEEAFAFPVGTVLIKTFAFAPDMRTPDVGGRYIETRLLIHKADGWEAIPYIWNEEQTEAKYAPVGAKRQIDTIAPDGEAITIHYAIPNKNQCKTCHASGDEITPIGPKARNLNHDGPAGINQIADWTSRGVLQGAPAPDAAPRVPPAFDADEPIEARARAWLDVNCAHCHKADGGASNSGLFLDWHETDRTGWGVHKRPVAAGRGAGDDLFVIEPGVPDHSILVGRMESTEPGVLMPELGRTVVDHKSIDLIRAWIAGMDSRGNSIDAG